MSRNHFFFDIGRWDDYCKLIIFLIFQLCSHFQWEGHKDREKVFTTFSCEDEATNDVGILVYDASIYLFVGGD
jgi:hypothetical protein